ncbi:MAG: alpha/beta hydrolase [Halioglobus sp.]|nr:alpha/beta hydrolase [Halioglobus sp.]
MSRELWYTVGVIAALLLLVAMFAVKKIRPFEARADQRITYKTVAGDDLELYAFFAQDMDGPAPALLLLHGGAWQFGTPAQMFPQCEFFAQRGLHCFALQYRISGNALPDVRGAIEDTRDAFDYLCTHARDLRLDPSRVYVGGGSAGGHLAAALGAGIPDESAARPAGLILYNPMIDLAPDMPDHHLVSDYWEEVSPLHHVDANTPPALVLLGDRDPEVSVATAERFCAAMAAVGAHCEVEVYAGQGHGFFNYNAEDTTYFDATNERVLEFLRGK